MDLGTDHRCKPSGLIQSFELPGALGAVVSELSAGYGVSSEAACILCLAVAGAAVGAAARIRPGPEPDGIAPNLLLALGDDNGRAQNCIGLLLSPLRQIQSDLIDGQNLRKARLDIRERELHAMLTRLDTARFPDASHIAAVQEELRRLQRQLQVQIIADNLRPGMLPMALHQSFDGAM